MTVELVPVGYGNVIAMNRVVAVLSPDSAPIRRMIQEAKAEKRVIDVTSGRKTKAAVVLDTGHIVLTAFHAETIMARLLQQRADHSVGND